MIIVVHRMSYNLTVSPMCGANLGPSLSQSCSGSQFVLFMTILNSLIQSQEKISQSCERVKPKNPPDYHYDFIVVGGE